MLQSEVQEIIISGDDHRILSASAEAWALVYNDVFVPMEDFLAGESRGEFLRRLVAGDHTWFAISFAREPGTPYLACFAEEHSIKDPGENGYNHRILIARADHLLAAHQEMMFTLGSCNAMLGLFEDVFFEYRAKDNTVRLYNTDRSRFSEGVQPFEAFADTLRSLTEENNRQALDTFLNHVRGGTPRFAVSIPENLFNEDHTVTGTIIKGAVAHHGGYEESIVGYLHPQRLRGTEGGEHTYDALTGLVNKADITQLAVERIDSRRAEGTAIAIVDVDYFKHVNDNYGHQYGDQVLRQIASIMSTEVADRGIVGRIGGDEFFIVFYHVDEEELRAHLRSIKSMVNATFQGKGPQGYKPISVSIGTATYPRDADNYKDLFLVADFCLYRAKEKGRNRYIIYTPEKHPTLEQIKNKQTGGGRNLVNGRDDLPLGDALVQMQFLIRYGRRPALSALLPEFADRFGIPLIMLFVEHPARLIVAAGEQAEEVGAAVACAERTYLVPALRDPKFQKLGFIVFNNVERLPESMADIRDRMLSEEIRSFVVSPFTDAAGNAAVLVFVSLHRNIFWNEQHYMYYRLFTDSLALYDLKGALPE